MAVSKQRSETKTEEEVTQLREKDASADYDDVVCGLGLFRPLCLQPCAKIVPFVGFASCSAFITSALVVYISSQITTLERMFGFSSSTSGFIMSCNDIGYLTCILFFTYFARRTHIPRVLSVATMFYGVAGLICCIPYFLTSDKFLLDNLGTTTSTTDQNKIHLCQKNTTIFNYSQTCDNHEDDEQSGSMFGLSIGETRLAVALISIGMLLQGFAKSPRSSYLSTYIDDNAPRTKTAQYIGVSFACALLGPAAAFGLGGVFSRMYITLEDTDMNLRDTRWLGAWWLGFLLFGATAILIAIPIYFFPKHLLPKSKRLSVSKSGKRKPFNLKGLPRALCRLVLNPVYFPLVIIQILGNFSIAGNIAFGAKYVETQFHLPVWKANMILGGGVIISAFTGTLIGGKIVSHFKLSPTACMKMLTALYSLYLITSLPLLFIGCPQQLINEAPNPANTNYTNSLNTSTCVSDCGCDSSFIVPVCDQDLAVTYYSPCHAGCSTRNGTIFSDCTCASTGKVTYGYCPSECSMWIPFVITTLISQFVVTLSLLSFIIALMRSVSEEDKPFALGLSAFLANLLGWLPAPILYGYLIDTTCLKWNSRCSAIGSCAVYDNADFRYKYHGLNVAIRGFALLIKFCVLWKITRSDFFNTINISKQSEHKSLAEITNTPDEILKLCSNSDDCKNDISRNSVL